MPLSLKSFCGERTGVSVVTETDGRATPDSDCAAEVEPISAGRIASHRRDLQVIPITEDIVSVQADATHVAEALFVTAGRIDRPTGVLGHGHLRCGDLVRPVRGLRQAGIHLEMNMRPAARVTGRKDRAKPHLTLAISLLDAAQVVLAGNALGVQGVSAFPVA